MSAVPDSLLKKQKREEEWAKQKADEAANTAEAREKAQKIIFERAAKYEEEYRSAVSDIGPRVSYEQDVDCVEIVQRVVLLVSAL